MICDIKKKNNLSKDLLEEKSRKDKWQFVTLVSIRRGCASDAKDA